MEVKALTLSYHALRYHTKHEQTSTRKDGGESAHRATASTTTAKQEQTSTREDGGESANA